jgi:hypothetical protein
MAEAPGRCQYSCGADRRHCEERKRRSNPAFFAQSWIASLRSQ